MDSRDIQRFLLAPAFVAVAVVVFLWIILPPVRALSSLEMSGGVLAVFVVALSFQWALQPQPDSGVRGVKRSSLLDEIGVLKSAERTAVCPAQSSDSRESESVADTAFLGRSLTSASQPIGFVEDKSALDGSHVPSISKVLSLESESVADTVILGKSPTRASQPIAFVEDKSALDGSCVPSISKLLPLEAMTLPHEIVELPNIPLELVDVDESHQSAARPNATVSPRQTEILSAKPGIEERQRRRHDASSDSTTLRWVGKGEAIILGNFDISDPLVYVGDGRDCFEESSCIDRLQIVPIPTTRNPERLPYYPEYATISNRQRADYLLWLAGGRCGPLSEIGYAFLYFYGLERRLLLEGKDLSPIVKEVVRLLEAYAISASFDRYLSRFLSYSLARTGIGTLKEKWFQSVFERTRAQRDEQHLAVGLAWLLTNQRSLPANWALRVARLDPRASSSVILERVPEQFATLFTRRYQERYGDGMALTAAKRDRIVSYVPANPSLLRSRESGTTQMQPVPIPDVLAAQSQFAPLISIWASCIEELRPLNRVMARGMEVSTRLAYEALPDDLKAATEHPDSVQWQRLVTEHVDTEGTVLVSAGAIAKIQGFDERAKLTMKQSESIAQTAHWIGLVVEPDARVMNRAYGWTDRVILFRPETRPALPSGGEYRAASVLLELGMFIAAADAKIEKDEVDHIASYLESQFRLDPLDARRLEALKTVLMVQPPTLSGSTKHLKTILDQDELESVGQFLFGVAAANGKVEKSELTALRSAYRALGLDLRSIDKLAAEHDRALKEPIEVRPTIAPIHDGESIPPPAQDSSSESPGSRPIVLRRPMAHPSIDTVHIRPSTGASGSDEWIPAAQSTESELTSVADGELQIAPGVGRHSPKPPSAPKSYFQLNSSVIEALMRETKQVTELLDEAMGEEEQEHSADANVPVESLVVVDVGLDPRFEGLDPRYRELLGTLCDCESWTREQFDELVRRHSLMAAGTFDRINEWAYERFDDPILESQGDKLIVHAKLILEQA
jgi:tellurite resistance protein